MALYIKQVFERFHSFHYVLVILMYRCKLKLNLVWKAVIIYIQKYNKVATRMAESSNDEGSKPTTVEDLIQLLTTQQRLQQEKFFEMMSTFLTALQASVPVRQ